MRAHRISSESNSNETDPRVVDHFLWFFGAALGLGLLSWVCHALGWAGTSLLCLILAITALGGVLLTGFRATD